ncbi:MAG: tyrosine protein phosphatase [Ruminococcaceae bacterium]|nr:tyrosine protein phosphatase [Oscillospiraceae bacterium]
MIDIHCHILPGVDDGADTIDDAVRMARMASAGGVRAIIATPHSCVPAFPPNIKSVSLLDRFREFSNAVRAAGIPLKVYSGAEILCTRDMPKFLEQGRLLTLASSKYFLMEFYFNSDPNYINSMLKLVSANGLIPVIAHPERYHAVQAFPHLVEEWNERGYVIQINKGSITGQLGYSEQNTARWILSNGLAHVVASDAHGINKRTPRLDGVYRHLEEKLIGGYAELLLKENPGRIICDMPVISIRNKTDFEDHEDY